MKQCNSTGTAAEDFADCDPEKQACLGGASVNKSCTPGTAVCNGLSEVQTCNANGLGFATTDCGNGFACKDGECNIQVCTPNTILCVGTEIHQCGTLGLIASQVKDCAGQGKVCLNGVCTDQICTPNTSYCNGNKVMQCDATGISESIKQTCSSDQYCASGGSCKAQVCTPISMFCDGQKLMTCNATGSGSEITQDCTATGKFCIENACVDVPPGSKDNPALSCKAILDAQASTGDGTYWIDPDGDGANQSFQAYCDMTTDGGGWAVVYTAPNANQNTGKAGNYTLENTALFADSQDVLLAFRDAESQVLPGYASLKLPEEWKIKAPFQYLKVDAVVSVSIDGATPQTGTLRYGYNSFDGGGNCSKDWLGVSSVFGRICIIGGKAPSYASFAVSQLDWCSTSTEYYKTQLCSSKRIYTIAIR